MPRDLQGAENIIEELLVQVSGDQLEEMFVQQGEHLLPDRLLNDVRRAWRDVSWKLSMKIETLKTIDRWHKAHQQHVV